MSQYMAAVLRITLRYTWRSCRQAGAFLCAVLQCSVQHGQDLYIQSSTVNYALAEVFEGVSASEMQDALMGKTIKAAHRKGKHMWLEMDPLGAAVVLHFGE